MKWYEIVECANAVDDPLVTDSHDLRGFDEWSFARGKLIDGWDNSAWLKAGKPDDDGNPDDVLQNHLGIPIYSCRLRQALRLGGVGGVQYLPVRILRPGDSEVPGFAIANVLSLVPAMDPRRSDYDVYPEDYFLAQRRGNVSGIRKAVLRWEALKGLDIIRLKEFPLWIGVSGRFKDVFEQGRFTGYEFEEVRLSG